MRSIERDVISIPRGYRSREAASFLAQMDDLSRRLRADTRGLTPAELEWQPARGMNTIGMLLAHLAIVEVSWTCRGILGMKETPFVELLGIDRDDDGMPMPARGRPPKILAGRPLAFFDRRLDLARARLRAVAKSLGERDLDRVESRVRASGRRQRLNARWVLYHLLEHFAGHYGQILLLRHEYRVARRRAR
jgi:uncharacterized damage-inducible protein DinB